MPLRCCVLFCVCTLMLFSCKNPSDEGKKQGPWIKTWGDEFNGTGAPEAKKWDRPEYNRRNNDSGPDGWWLQEDSYLDGKGNLVLRAKKINNRNSDKDQFDYSTGAIRSYGKFQQQFGRFEIRCQLPTQPGWWVAFWLMSEGVGNVNDAGEDGTEIDIFEGFGWTDAINHALHWNGYGAEHQSEGHMAPVPGIRNGFHTFALEWEKDMYRFYVDDIETWRSAAGGVSKVPAYVKITAELSTESWAVNQYWSNNPARAVFPDSFLVDYVRVFKKR